ncbi:MAG TPA: substrate-binding domain-containing protein, partial [Bryobacteraceae bacterium]|nr:substrate-binding domain-containing protein [Bryobacteraceae bacterium]
HVEKADFTRAGGFEAALRIAETLPDTSAVFAMNDVMAIGALQAFEQAGKAVPADIAVVGFDGIQMGLLTRPRLTTFVIPSWEIGRTLADLLVDRIEGRFHGPAKNLVVSGRLAIRESTLGSRKDAGLVSA